MALPDEGVFSRNDVYPSADTLMQVEEKTRESADLENTSNSVLNSILRKGSSGGTSPDASVSSTSFNFSFPSASSSSDGHKPTPSRRKFGAPSSIPNFPSANDARTPSSHRPVSHSPSQSPFRSPITTPTQQPSVPIAQTQPFVSPQNLNGPSPWVALAASSGAPTPSIEDGPSTSRASPHLGYPFERLNIGGSWSGANLWGASDGMQGRTSAESNTDKGSPKAAVHSTPSGLTPETLAKYRAKAGMLSSTNSRTKSQGLALDGVETDSDTTASSSSKIPVSTAKHRREDLVPDRSPRLISTPESDHDFLNPHPANPGTPSSGKLNSLTIISLRAMATRSTTLILDLRPPSAFLASHLPSSHSLPIPSTLLRRPAFNLQKLVQMLPSPSSEEVSKWRDRSDIVLIDLDSIAAPRGGVLDGLAGKFDREDFSGHLWFVRGGYKAVQSIDGMGVSSKHGNDDEGAHTATGPGRLMAGRLGKLAFLPESTNSDRKAKASHYGMKLNLAATPGLALRADPFSAPTTMSTSIRTVSPMSGLTIGSQAVPKMPDVTSISNVKLQPANPFFDNIRQNLELSHGGITERIPLGLAPDVLRRATELPSWLGNLVNLPDTECSEILANQFYRIERGEQKRLQAVMDFHSRGSGGSWPKSAKHDPDPRGEAWFEQRAQDAAEVKRLAAWTGGTQTLEDQYFPFSITAGVERGTKNRYKNIWPYDFSRVRLFSPTDDDSDYMNASFVQPHGTAKRYIATQGPMDATYRDFWTLIWEQNVRIIVMLTKQFEGGLIKCGNYWDNQKYGQLRLRLVSQTGGEDLQYGATTGFDFGTAALPPQSNRPQEIQNIKRVFLLSHEGDAGPPKRVVQIQCTAWPDFDVPDTPDVLLSLIDDVNEVTEEIVGTDVSDSQNPPPVLVHCSAGVGRTGSFIIADAIIDGMRKERRNHNRGPIAPLSASPNKSPLFSHLGLHRSTLSSGGKTTGSTDSAKSVSFLSPTLSQPSVESSPRFLSASPAAIVKSPPAFPTPTLASSNSNVESYLDAKIVDAATGTVPAQKDEMELDPPAELQEGARDVPNASQSYDQFTRHRGSVAASVDSEEGWTRRPSLASAYDSSDKLSLDGLNRDLGNPSPVNRSRSRLHTPSPISEMADPIESVLGGMRVQRMSLVQTLRQYIFVYRVIIQSCLRMIDEEHLGHRAKSGSVDSEAGSGSRSSTTPLTLAVSTPPSSQGEDEDSKAKRRASPIDGNEFFTPDLTGLARRPSVKRMRAAKDGITPNSSPNLGQGVKDSPGKMKSRSKLAWADDDEARKSPES